MRLLSTEMLMWWWLPIMRRQWNTPWGGMDSVLNMLENILYSKFLSTIKHPYSPTYSVSSRMNELGLSPTENKVSFGQLLGMCDQISFPLGERITHKNTGKKDHAGALAHWRGNNDHAPAWSFFPALVFIHTRATRTVEWMNTLIVPLPFCLILHLSYSQTT